VKSASLLRTTSVFLVLFGVLLRTTFPVCASLPDLSDEELVDIKKVDPTVIVELRYAGSRNIAGKSLYPPHMPALVRTSVAQRLVRAQAYLRANHYGLKIWDAYRPPLAQLQLWQLSPQTSYVADPNVRGGSLHTWGVAVDATLVDEQGNEVAMPTDFDVFTPAANLHYQGDNSAIRLHLKILQTAMRRGGFYGLRTEWWHFIAYDWKKFGPVREVRLSSQ